MKMNKDRMKFVLNTAIEVVEDMLREMCMAEDEVHDFILTQFEIDEDEYNYITGGTKE